MTRENQGHRATTTSVERHEVLAFSLALSLDDLPFLMNEEEVRGERECLSEPANLREKPRAIPVTSWYKMQFLFSGLRAAVLEKLSDRRICRTCTYSRDSKEEKHSTPSTDSRNGEDRTILSLLP